MALDTHARTTAGTGAAAPMPDGIAFPFARESRSDAQEQTLNKAVIAGNVAGERCHWIKRPLLVVQGDKDARVKKDQSDRIVSALSSRSFLTVSPDDAVALRGPDAKRRRAELGIGLVLDGVVERPGSTEVDARIEDPNSGSVLWSVQLQGAGAALPPRRPRRNCRSRRRKSRHARRDPPSTDPRSPSSTATSASCGRAIIRARRRARARTSIRRATAIASWSSM